MTNLFFSEQKPKRSYRKLSLKSMQMMKWKEQAQDILLKLGFDRVEPSDLPSSNIVNLYDHKENLENFKPYIFRLIVFPVQDWNPDPNNYMAMFTLNKTNLRLLGID